MPCCNPGGAGPCGSPIMLGASLNEGLFNPWLYVTFRLATNRRQLRNHKITCPLKHSLFAKRQWLQLTEVGQVLEHFSRLKNIASAHLLGKVFETIFPVIGRE